MIHLDFETRSELDIWKVGAWNYSKHPSTEILCMAFCINSNKVESYTFDIHSLKYPALLENILDMVGKGCLFHAHYSMFENYIWHNILVKRYGWPEVPLRHWRCTAALAASYALPRALAKAAKALGTEHQKDLAGKAVMLKMCKPRKATKNNKDKWHESEEDFEKLNSYCIDDVEVEREIDQTLPALSKMEQELWFLDQKINTRGIQVDTEAVDAALYLIEKFSDECNSRLKVISEGYLNKASQVQRFKNWMGTKGVHVASLDKGSVTKLIEEQCCEGAYNKVPSRDFKSWEVRYEETIKGNKYTEILEALKIRQQIGKTSVKKFVAFKNATCDDGRVRDMFVYHGASTGRWAGKIVQLHNLPRGNLKDPELCIGAMKWKNLEAFRFLYPDVMGAISSCVRGALVTAPGKDLLVVDFAAIEARVLAWIAGEEVALEEFRTGVDSYVKMAEAIFGTGKVTKDMRFVGKTAVLGCGFGMGWKVFQATCAGMGQEVSEALAKKAVKTFRKKNKQIVTLWRDVEVAAINAVRNHPGDVYFAGNTQWYVEGDFLYCKLPSGRKLAYHHPKIQRVPYFDSSKAALTFMGVAQVNNYTRQQTWGGTLVENIVQATARDILAEAMLRVEKAGYKVILHVHDEIVVEVGENEAQSFGLEGFIKLTTELPAWAKGCPIDAEGWRGKRYRK